MRPGRQVWTRRLAVLALCTVAASTEAATPDVVYEWTTVEFSWPNAATRAAYIADGRYIIANCIVTGIKVYGSDVFVTVPRWRRGVPSTLNRVVSDGTGGHMLEPYPSWEWQQYGDHDTVPSAARRGLRYVQSMEVTPDGLMYILDVGRLHIFDDPIDGQPRLLVYDIVRDRLVSEYAFEDSVASHSASFLNDLVVDQATRTVYISDTGTGALVVFDGASKRARRYAGVSTRADISLPFAVAGLPYPAVDSPADGIALSADATHVFFCALRGYHLYSLEAAHLRDFALSSSDLDALVVNHGRKPPSDGLAMTADGRLFFGSLTGSAVLVWDTSDGLPLGAQQVMAQSNDTMQWPDTFAFDNVGNLWFTTNKLQLYFANTMKFDGSTGSNVHVLKLRMDGQSYLTAQAPYPGKNMGTATIVGIAAALTASMAVIVALLMWVTRMKSRQQVAAPASSPSSLAQPLIADT